jgi:hypothetical protein
MNETFSVTPGGSVESYAPHGFSLVYGIWIDNFSGGWLQVQQGGLWCPPYTRGWKAEIFPGTSAVTIRSYDFANGTQINGATGQNAQVTIWDAPTGNSEGIDFFDTQTVPVSFKSNPAPDGTRGSIVPAPAVGRLRLYSIDVNYHNTAGAPIYEDVLAYFYAGAAGDPFLITSISPASPTSRIVLNTPGTDMPIGVDLECVMFLPDTLTVVTWLTTTVVRYAVI